jgi:hypothetical protein
MQEFIQKLMQEWMQHFSIGLLTFIGALVFPVYYLVMRMLHLLGAMATRTERPKEVVGVFLVLGIVVGGFIGSMLEPLRVQGVACHQYTGRSVLACIFDPDGLFEKKPPTTSPAYPQSKGSSKSR